ncbi:MAG: thiamine-phosphate kinase [Chloroflexi bacterium]|nr:MAG: thiamine-phosphate kinase [Chloroflexota bacterium]
MGEAGLLGEFDVIARLTQVQPTRPDVRLGSGDDAALLDASGSHLLVATCDAQVDGVHFIRGVATYEEIGHKALAVNLSDIAAMGAEPRWALISLLIPSELKMSDLDQVYTGMRALAGRYSVALVGGNISFISGPFCIDMTLLGAVSPDRVLMRSGAQPGDLILVTGKLGAAAAGVLWSVSATDPALLALLSPETRERTRKAMVAPLPAVAEGRAIAESRTATAMIDVSDGLAQDLWHICQSSHVGAVLEAEWLPIDRPVHEVARVYGKDTLDLALYGGEDYVLLCTAKEDSVATLLEAIQDAGGVGRIIGRVVDPSQGMKLRLADGELRPLEPRGWDHLAHNIYR